ncbi:hypothetical protein B0T17DRAFT_529135 [Bombardia bombarda]|uniref:Uncharacterized protein n=1 Tax=Bombardia bombarda TaxID=252184 RepID=A0AA40C9S2_9PEZI|nr:hypothetical protein B0T17DRAFT_529135 [Bombardia bombarda]
MCRVINNIEERDDEKVPYLTLAPLHLPVEAKVPKLLTVPHPLAQAPWKKGSSKQPSSTSPHWPTYSPPRSAFIIPTSSNDSTAFGESVDSLCEKVPNIRSDLQPP